MPSSITADLDAERWIRTCVEPSGPLEAWHERPWATVLRVPVADGSVWFKACGAVQAFEPRLEAELSARWPDRVGEVLAHDADRAWLLLADAGAPVGTGTSPEVWLPVLPMIAELQRGEAARAEDHLAHGVPDLRLTTLPGRFEELVRADLPLAPEEVARLREFVPVLERLCRDLAAYAISETMQHDDLHGGNVYALGDRLRVLDWGDSSIAHPFFSLVVPFRFLEEQNRLALDDPWFTRLRDAYLEPWGAGHEEAFELAQRVGRSAHACAWLRQRTHLPVDARPEFDKWFAVVLRRAIALA